ncbi:hypothetical protein CC86DRAFT_361397 [Ophiobolus disseminans]|uniref:Sensor histidine kinase-like protein/response regulator n=1 Tax=Ophiobolus disseminans TaxID=1469910 RepID=A0A6A6ZFZ2_9PLEO|nr:hypothetical protein CC86DRAFT_361397 [Ophiobolus disseminans]
MEGPLRMAEPTTTFKRERDVLNLFAAFKNISTVENLGPSPDTHAIPSSYSPRPATDSSLAAFCQLAAIRLQASRSLISLIDEKSQYILAEATPRTSLKFDSPLNRTIDLGFGNVCLPRKWGICERVLDPVALAEGEDGVLIINDLSTSKLHATRSYVKDGPLRFYAGVPLYSCSGNIVGSVCILDDKVRDGLSQEDIQYLKDLSSTIMDYLETYTIRDRYRRGAEGLQGLMSFADGTNLKPINEHFQSPLSPTSQPTTSKEGLGQPREDTKPDISGQDSGSHIHTGSNASEPSPSGRRRSISELQESLVPATTKEVFARAADIMRQSNDMDGVTFIDASVAATGLQGIQSVEAGKRCQILGFATADESSLKGDVLPVDMTPFETNFAWVLEQYPQGYSLDCEEAMVNAWSENATPKETPADSRGSTNPVLQKADKDRIRHVESIQALIPNIKSALFLPLWDYDRGRWFAGCFCWSTRSERILDGRLDLPFLKAFGHSIMQEVARIDAMTTDQAKTTFLSSLSHELRTPLHGILGSTHLLRNTTLDSFQGSMINSINACGRTLLETVEHLLDHAERRESSRNYSSKTVSADNCICITSERLALSTPIPSGTTRADTKCNVGFVTEELVETMIIGQSPFDLALGQNSSEGSLADHDMRTASQRRSRLLILDIGDYEGLGSYLAASSYGRIVLNLFGNAMKFTESGLVHVSLRSEHVYGPNATIVLKISDSGVGMTRSFLKNSAFEPFRKQNPHTSGTGVGLSVVKRILEDIGGQIEVRSQPLQGTDITLRLPVERLNEEDGKDTQPSAWRTVMGGLKGRKVCIYTGCTESNDCSEQNQHQKNMELFVKVLSSTLSDVLKLDVRRTTIWDGCDDTEVFICPEVSFECLQTIRNSAASAKRRCPVTIFIAMDVLEAETLRSDARVTSRSSIVETMTQPCGPYKLAIVLRQCLQLYDVASGDSSKIRPTSPTDTSTSSSFPLSPLKSPLDLGSRVGLYPPPPLAIRTKPEQTLEEIAAPVIQAQTSPDPVKVDSDHETIPTVKQALIVDDNAINRKLLSAWMKRHKLPFKEAKDGLQALKTYKEADGKFDIILMDISMPVMDGMTSTRLIREHENEKGLTPAHIIALTGLTSASAKLEAWTSGVDDFLTKPVDFKKLESLIEVGRSGEGTGFWKDEGE